MKNKHLRWIIELDYITDNGIVTVEHHVEELTSIAELVEKGPDWNTLTGIRVFLNPQRRSHNKTVEESRKD